MYYPYTINYFSFSITSMTLPNIHPLVVHFPIACLVIYTILEVVSWLMPRRAAKLAVTKQILLFAGVASAWAALQTGEIAVDLGGGDKALDQHEEFAEMAYNTYGFLALWYVLQIIIGSWWLNAPAKLVTFVRGRWTHLLICLVAIYGSVLLMITGALGGSMVYGPDADPMVRIIYDLFVK